MAHIVKCINNDINIDDIVIDLDNDMNVDTENVNSPDNRNYSE